LNSIIIATFNEEKVIGSALYTLASTLTLPHEVIVSDGGSSDRTVELAAKYAAALVVFWGPAVRRLRRGEMTVPRPPVATSCRPRPAAQNNMFSRGESFREFQMIRQEAFTRLGRFRADLVTIEDTDMFRRLSKSEKP
jgi:glycosyltransferase involved in cell wall biosynthesis